MAKNGEHMVYQYNSSFATLGFTMVFYTFWDFSHRDLSPTDISLITKLIFII